MRVLHILGSLGMGGAERWLLEVLRYRREQSDDTLQFDFIATSGLPGMFDDEVRSIGGKVFYLPFRRLKLVSFAVEFRRILRTGNYAAIHDHQAWVCGWHFLLGAGLLPPIRIAHAHIDAHELDLLDPGRRGLARIGLRLISLFATRIVATSNIVMLEYGFNSPIFSGIPKSPLYCGIDPARFRGDRTVARASLCHEFGWPDNSAIILVAGRIDPSAEESHPLNWKNTSKAISIGVECAKRDSRIRMLFAGALSPAVPEYQERLKDAGLSDRFIFAGLRSDIAALMLASDVLLFPSRAEGLGMVAIEAQAAGLPVLASEAVPMECAVVPRLMRHLNVDAETYIWADNIFELLAQPRDVTLGNDYVASSQFAIAQSAKALVDIYAHC
jgi:glycosyltransferase involved in cell wall biosynthesis